MTQGAHSASPLLFPETVYNAAASHLAALLGVNGQSYTLVGDSSVGLGAIHFATELLTMQPELDRCLVVGTEEADWLLADAFASWRMATNRGSIRGVRPDWWNNIRRRRRGHLVRAHRDHWRWPIPRPACHSILIGTGNRRPERCSAICAPKEFPEIIVSSANGTFADEVERKVFREFYPAVPVYAPKPSLGEALGASALLQVAVAGWALRQQQLPGTLGAGPKLQSVNRQTRSCSASQALVTAVGFNHQVNALKLRLAESPY